MQDTSASTECESLQRASNTQEHSTRFPATRGRSGKEVFAGWSGLQSTKSLSVRRIARDYTWLFFV